MPKIRILVVGCGHMGGAHARAYHALEDFEIVGLVARTDGTREKLMEEIGEYPRFSGYHEALKRTRPDAVSINTYPGTHAPFALAALEAGAHVFVEKPLAQSIEAAQGILALARRQGKQVLVGHLLHYHAAYRRFIDLAKALGRPLVMRISLNQQSDGRRWERQKYILSESSPLLDCGVHYLDIMNRIMGGPPVRVQAMGARLGAQPAPTHPNYGMLQAFYADGSVGWFESGWGPMMGRESDTLRDAVGPEGSVTLQSPQGSPASSGRRTARLILHSSRLDAAGDFIQPDEVEEIQDEPTHRELCRLEQEYFLRAIRENLDLGDHHGHVLDSLAAALAAERALAEGRSVDL